MSGSSALFKKVALVVVFLVATAGLTAAVYKDRVFTPFDKEYYLTDEQVAFIRPGFNVEITDYNIAADRTVTVMFTAKDAGGLPLDLNGVYTPGSIRISFLIAYIPEDGTQYIDYATHSVTSPITNVTAIQPTSDSGTIEEIEIGTYRYTFGQKLPADYDRDATHSIGFYSQRDLSEFDLPSPVSDGVVTFVPSGAPVTQIRQLTTDAACAQCHDFLVAHGRRHKVELCIMCHYDGVIDPDTGNSVDMRVMIHKIHDGENLPSVQAGDPVRDHRPQPVGRRLFRSRLSAGYSQLCHLPRGQRGTGGCLVPVSHAGGLRFLPRQREFRHRRESCGWSLHYGSVLRQLPFPAGRIRVRRFDQGGPYGSVGIGAAEGHQHRTARRLELRPRADAHGAVQPEEQCRRSHRSGQPRLLQPDHGRADHGLHLDGQRIRPSGAVPVGAISSGVSTMAAGEYTYTFQTPLPEDAEGSYALGAEAYRNVTLNPGTVDEFSQRETAHNPVLYFAVTDPEPVPRRVIVDNAKCDSCHRDLALHGGIRHDPTDYCQMCHRPEATDAVQRPADAMPPQTIDLRFMVHRIHMGEELTRDFTIYGFNGSVNNFNEVLYPSDPRTCEKCHVDGTYNVPSEGIVSVVDEREFFSPIPPNSAACLGCHDTVDAAAHAFTNISPFGEGCGACHAAAREFAVAKVHAH